MTVNDRVMPVLDAVLAGRDAPAALDTWCREDVTVQLSGLAIQLRASSSTAARYTRSLFTPGSSLWNAHDDAISSTMTMRTIALPTNRVTALAERVRLRARGVSRDVKMHAQAPARWHRTAAGPVLVTDTGAAIAPQVVARHADGYTVITVDDTDAAMNAARHLREIGYRRAENDGWVCLHASAATIDGRGILFVGNSGAGKSSLALAVAAADDGAFLSNDRTMIAISPDAAPRAVAMPGPIRLNGGTLSALGLSHASRWNLARPKPASGSDWQSFQGSNKLHILPEEWRERTGTPLLSSAAVELIVFPQVIHGNHKIDSCLTPLGRARRLLAAQCMSPGDDIYVCDWLSIRHGNTDKQGVNSADVLDALARRPSMDLRFGTDTPYRTVTAAIKDRLDALPRT
ncbi:hypothetical protein GA0070604_0565 [Micromonospora eburnea]|uniref:HprK-related kinase B n=2 Tax=Micromonospora eburnea TaxID=227316 RepID=A0A1C6TSE1_9ACTN|nr:hypothetical protein GA0070604_0565 [Micromonospora eburnea]